MPIKEDLKTIGYEFAYNVHGQEGVNKWMLVASDAKSRAESEKATIDKLATFGCDCDSAEADAAEWSE